jgi:hypothetical protein
MFWEWSYIKSGVQRTKYVTHIELSIICCNDLKTIFINIFKTVGELRFESLVYKNSWTPGCAPIKFVQLYRESNCFHHLCSRINHKTHCWITRCLCSIFYIMIELITQIKEKSLYNIYKSNQLVHIKSVNLKLLYEWWRWFAFNKKIWDDSTTDRFTTIILLHQLIKNVFVLFHARF